jgi:hypothetical protein
VSYQTVTFCVRSRSDAAFTFHLDSFFRFFSDVQPTHSTPAASTLRFFSSKIQNYGTDNFFDNCTCIAACAWCSQLLAALASVNAGTQKTFIL